MTDLETKLLVALKLITQECVYPEGEETFAYKNALQTIQQAEKPTKVETVEFIPRAEQNAGKKLYDEYSDNHPTIHSNRFPSWHELSFAERAKWREDAKKYKETGEYPEW